MSHKSVHQPLGDDAANYFVPVGNHTKHQTLVDAARLQRNKAETEHKDSLALLEKAKAELQSCKEKKRKLEEEREKVEEKLKELQNSESDAKKEARQAKKEVDKLEEKEKTYLEAFQLHNEALVKAMKKAEEAEDAIKKAKEDEDAIQAMDHKLWNYVYKAASLTEHDTTQLKDAFNEALETPWWTTNSGYPSLAIFTLAEIIFLAAPSRAGILNLARISAMVNKRGYDGFAFWGDIEPLSNINQHLKGVDICAEFTAACDGFLEEEMPQYFASHFARIITELLRSQLMHAKGKVFNAWSFKNIIATGNKPSNVKKCSDNEEKIMQGFLQNIRRFIGFYREYLLQQNKVEAKYLQNAEDIFRDFHEEKRTKPKMRLGEIFNALPAEDGGVNGSSTNKNKRREPEKPADADQVGSKKAKNKGLGKSVDKDKVGGKPSESDDVAGQLSTAACGGSMDAKKVENQLPVSKRAKSTTLDKPVNKVPTSACGRSMDAGNVEAQHSVIDGGADKVPAAAGQVQFNVSSWIAYAKFLMGVAPSTSLHKRVAENVHSSLQGSPDPDAKFLIKLINQGQDASQKVEISSDLVSEAEQHFDTMVGALRYKICKKEPLNPKDIREFICCMIAIRQLEVVPRDVCAELVQVISGDMKDLFDQKLRGGITVRELTEKLVDGIEGACSYKHLLQALLGLL